MTPAAKRLTSEREAYLRLKPEHYHVHEVWPELDALRARIKELESENADLNEENNSLSNDLRAAQAREEEDYE